MEDHISAFQHRFFFLVFQTLLTYAEENSILKQKNITRQESELYKHVQPIHIEKTLPIVTIKQNSRKLAKRLEYHISPHTRLFASSQNIVY